MKKIPAQAGAEEKKTDWLSVIVLWFAGIGAAMQFAKFSVSFDHLQEIYNAEAAHIGLAVSMVGAVGIFFGVASSVLAVRFGYIKTLITALALGGVVSLLQSGLPPIPILLASRFLEGASHLGVVVVAPTLIIQLTARKHLSIIMAVWGAFFGVAFALTGLVGPGMLKIGGVPFLLQMHALYLFILIGCILLIRRRMPTFKQTLQATRNPFAGFLRDNFKVYASPRTVLPGAIFFFHTAMYIALLTFLPRQSENPDAVNSLLVVLPLASTAGILLAGIISQYFLSPLKLSVIAYVITAAMAFIPAIVSGSFLPFVLVSVFLMIIVGIVPGATFAMIPMLSKTPEQQANANGAVAQLGNFGATLGPPAFALAIDHEGTMGLVWVTVLLCVGGILVGLTAMQRYSAAD